MSLSVAPLVVSLIVTNRIRKYVRTSILKHWEQPLKYALFLSVMLFAAEVIFSETEVIKWVWHAYLIAIIVFALKQDELRLLRMFIVAFIPFELFSLLGDLTQLINDSFFKDHENYFNNATGFSFFWMAAILYSQNRQFKAAEKERIKRQHEDELNRAIAIRKVELEVLVAERTSELTEQKEELENALDELRATQTQLIQSEKMASLGELTAGIAHEIQNPLNFVNNFSEVNAELIEEMQEEIEKGNMDEVKALAKDIADNEQKIKHHGKRADAIVKGMLQHSRSNSGIKEPTNINALADEYLRLAYHGLRAKDKSFNVTMETHFDKSIISVNIIPQDMGRAILNLITNAFYAVNEKNKLQRDIERSENRQGLPPYQPTVSLRTSRISPTKGVAGKVKISVRDNGNGIPQNALDKIFQPFFTTKPTGEGTGLGLSLSYDIVKAHGGELKVDTNEGQGAEFSIILPV